MNDIQLDLTPYFNAVCASSIDNPAAGVVNAWGNSFPLEEMPFGQQIVIGGVAFLLPPKVEGEPDHIECCGQWIPIPGKERRGESSMLWVLGFGELGDQTLQIMIEDPMGRRQTTNISLTNWLRAPGVSYSTSGWQASCLRYAVGYDLKYLLPTIEAIGTHLSRATSVHRLQLGKNPLAHILAISLTGD